MQMPEKLAQGTLASSADFPSMMSYLGDGLSPVWARLNLKDNLWAFMPCCEAYVLCRPASDSSPIDSGSLVHMIFYSFKPDSVGMGAFKGFLIPLLGAVSLFGQQGSLYPMHTSVTPADLNQLLICSRR